MAGSKHFSEIILDDFAIQIHEAIKSGTQIEPLSQSHGIDYSTAVEVRRRVANLLGRYAGMPRGYKIAFTSPVTQKRLGFSSPEFGYLFDNFELQCSEPVETGGLCEPYAEPEIAFVMAGHVSGPGVTAEDVLSATKFICPAIEIVDSRFGMDRASNADMVADNVQFGRFILGTGAFGPGEFDLTSVPVTIEVDGETAESTTGYVMGNPAEAVAWLANKFAESDERDGAIEKGSIILSGSCTGYFPVRAGSRLSARYGPLGEINLEFV